MMRMLDAGGFPVFGAQPSYEKDELIGGCDLESVMPKITGRASKLLDAHRVSKWPSEIPNCKIIWLERNIKEQAKSQVKFLQLAAGLDIPSSAWRVMRSQLRMDHSQCMRVLDFRDILVLHFERILKDPIAVAHTLERYLEMPMNVEAMASVVIQRSPKCAAGLEIESSAVAEADRKQR